MKPLFFGVGDALKSLQSILVGFGVFGIFFIALLDAGMFPLVGGPDIVLMTMSHLYNSMMPLYVFAVTLGSTLGCLLPYYFGRKTGEAALRRFSPEKRARVMGLIERYDVWTVLVAALLPPPFPLKIFIITAGVFKMNLRRFLIALFIGRSVRYTLEGILAVRFGDQAATIFRHHYPKIGLAIAGLIILIVLINRIRSGKKNNGDLPGADLTAEN